MNIVILVIIFTLSGFMVGFGKDGRSKFKLYTYWLSFWVWIAGVIYAFISGGIVFGLIVILVSLLWTQVMMRVGKRVSDNMRR